VLLGNQRHCFHHGNSQLQHKHSNAPVYGIIRRRREGQTTGMFNPIIFNPFLIIRSNALHFMVAFFGVTETLPPILPILFRPALETAAQDCSVLTSIVGF
jgi:hypothetical protein